MKKYFFICIALFSCLLCVNAQQTGDEAKAYNDYLLGLECYRISAELSVEISRLFMEGDIKEVRRLSTQREELLLQAIDSIIAFRPGASRSEVAAQMVTRLCHNLSFDNIWEALKHFESDFEPESLRGIRNMLEKEAKVRPGMIAADFELFDKDGNIYSLESFAGKFIFLEFSASWCSWCKKETPFILSAYEQFNDQVIFITVHLDNDRNKWLKDLENHPIPWLCLTDLKAWESPVAKAYNIGGVPESYVIAPDGRIVAKSLRMEEVTECLDKLMADGEGIRFYGESFDQALARAQDENKLIFMDCYTSWCAPCKMMNSTVFRDPEVGAFFNENFVNVKFDMERGEGRKLLKRYMINVFPTYLLIDGDGDELHRVVGGHDAKEFIELITNGMNVDNSIAGLQKRYDTGERGREFLHRYITALGGGYRFDRIPEVLDELCSINGVELGEEDWTLIRRYLSDPASYAFRFIAANRDQVLRYTSSDLLEEWIGRVLYAPVFNMVNEAVFDQQKHSDERAVALREAIDAVRPQNADHLIAILDFYSYYRQNKIKRVLNIYKKKFMNLPGSERFGLTMMLNAMLLDKGNKRECRKGLNIFNKVFNPADPIFINFEKALRTRIESLSSSRN